ncbi:MAG: tyrosine-type recombinase/integrase [Candidatus Sulfobium sp.]
MLNHLAGFQDFLIVLEGLTRATAASYTRKVREFHAWLIGSGIPARPDGIGRQHVEAYLQYCFYQRNSNQTRYTKLTALKKFWRYLKYEGVVSEDITSQIPKPKLHINRVQKFTKTEILSFFRAIDITREKGLRDAVIFILGAFCGLRIGEICKLRLGDVIDNGENIDIAIPEDIGKKHRERTVYIWKAPGTFIRAYTAVRLAQGAKIQNTLLVSYKFRRPSSRPVAASDVDDLIKRYAAKADIKKPRITSHMLRATHACDLRNIRGYDSAAIAGRMGHASIATTDRYLPDRGRIPREYPSLAVYWKEFNHIWNKGEANDNISSGAGHPANKDISGGDAVDGQT